MYPWFCVHLPWCSIVLEDHDVIKNWCVVSGPLMYSFYLKAHSYRVKEVEWECSTYFVVHIGSRWLHTLASINVNTLTWFSHTIYGKTNKQTLLLLHKHWWVLTESTNRLFWWETLCCMKPSDVHTPTLGNCSCPLVPTSALPWLLHGTPLPLVLYVLFLSVMFLNWKTENNQFLF